MTPRTATLAAALATALALPLTAAAPALAQTLIPGDGQALAEHLRRAGYRADIDHLDSGRPFIRSGSDGLNFFIFLRDCEGGENCRNIQFHASFNMQTPPTAERLNEWNSSRIVGQAFLDGNGQPRIGHFVAMRGGISAEAFDTAFAFFRDAMRDYADHIGFRR